MTTNKPEVKRFDCTSSNLSYCYGCYTMSEEEYGDYVAWEDYEALKAECEQLRKDAERYRWLREQCGNSGLLTIAKVGAFELKTWSGDDPDTAIDAAMAGGDQ